MAESKNECLAALRALLKLLRALGFQINWKKVVDPTQRIVFLGMIIDTVRQELELPREKLCELTALLKTFVGRTRATRLQLQVLAGKLNWACQAVRGGRTFLRRILDAMASLQRARHKRKLSGEFQADIMWWLKFLETFNGRVLFPSLFNNYVYMDASTGGSGVCYGGDWLYTNWREDWPHVADLHINHKETLSVLIEACRWAPWWANSTVIIYTDNTTAKAALNKTTSRNKLVMRALRELFWLSVQFNFMIKAIHVPGKDHLLADSASRLHQKGHLAKLDALQNSSLTPISLLRHMSVAALRSIISQVCHWWNWKQRWTQKSNSTGGLPFSRSASNLGTTLSRSSPKCYKDM